MDTGFEDRRHGPPTAILAGIALAFPPHELRQSVARDFAARHFSGRNRDTRRLLPVFDHAAIETRRLTLPLEAYAADSTFAERNRVFIETASRLAQEAATAALEDAGIRPSDVTHVILVTSTGIATPTLECRFAAKLGIPETARRIPLWGLGCAGGASGLALARELVQSAGRTVLLVAVELCSLAFLPRDPSTANLVATALFGDGAAAAVVVPGSPGRPGLRLGNHREELIPDSRDVMGWDLTTEGLQVVFQSRIPSLVAETWRGTVERALAPHGCAVEDLECLAVHPGGRRVLEAETAALGLPPVRFASAWDALRCHGNISSVSVLIVLEQLRSRGLWGRPGIVSAFGPGFTSHVMALPGSRET